MDLSSTLTESSNIETDETINESLFNRAPQTNLFSSSSSLSSSSSHSHQYQNNFVEKKRRAPAASSNNKNVNADTYATISKSLSSTNKNQKLSTNRLKTNENKRINANELYYNLNDQDSRFEYIKTIDNHLTIDGRRIERIYGGHHDVSYERVNFVWFELAVPATLLLFSICGCICLIVLFVIWTNLIRSNAKKCDHKADRSLLPFSDAKNEKHCSRIAIAIDKHKNELITTTTTSVTLKPTESHKVNYKNSSSGSRHCKYTNETAAASVVAAAAATETIISKYKEKRENIALARMENSKLSNLNDSTEQLASDHKNGAIVDVKHSSANINETFQENEFSVQSDRAHHVPDVLSSSAKVSISQQTYHISQSTAKQLQNSPKYTRSLSVSGDVFASSSEQSSIDINRKKISSQKKSESSTSSPAMSPSIQQQKQYNRLNTQRSVELMHSTNDKENTMPDSPAGQMHSQYGSAIDYRLDSPKFTLAEQNSPNTPLSCYKSPPSTHSSPMYTAHETPRSDCNIFTYSPLITEPYKHSTYFHFPDVDTPSPLMSTPAAQQQQQQQQQHEKSASACMINNNNLIIGRVDKSNDSNGMCNATNNNVNQINNNNNNNNINNNMKSSQTTPTLTADSCDQTDLSVRISNWPGEGSDSVDALGTSATPALSTAGSTSGMINIHRLHVSTNDECGGTSGTKTKKEVRRARLKSISLDSDNARLVEENLCIPVEELVEKTLPQTQAFDEDDTMPFHSPAGIVGPGHHSKCLSKNINRLVLDLSIRDDSLPHEHQLSPANDASQDEYLKNLSSKSKATTPKTPTLTQTRQKAISLDSDPKVIEYGRGYPPQSTSTDFGHPLNGNSGNNVGILRSKPHLMTNFLNVETNSSMSVPTTPKRQQVVKSTLSKLSPSTSKMGIIGKKMGYASSAEYFSSKKSAERKCLEKLPQLNTETEPIFEGAVSDYYDDVYAMEHDQTGSFDTTGTGEDIDCDINCGSIDELSNFGNSNVSGHGNSNVGNQNTELRSGIGAGGLSLSNYSLSNFQGSHCSLTRSNYNIFGSMASSTLTSAPQNLSKAATVGGNSNVASGGSRFFNASAQPTMMNAKLPSSSSTSRSNFCLQSKKNLLQRRGSNTSLTLNIVAGTNNVGGSSIHSTLNRFNSHNSLNVMSTPFDVQRNNNLATTKKGLLERRNSNASLTLNIQKRALSTSNCYLRGSDLSLSSAGNNFESQLDEHRVCTMCGGGGILRTKNIKRSMNAPTTDETRQNDIKMQATEGDQSNSQVNAGCEAQPLELSNETQSQTASSVATSRPKVSRSAGHRKFFSSENLNVHNTFSLCQPPTKTSSVVDLNQSNSEMLQSDGDAYDEQETTYCACSNNITRNITTKPLSPQTTSEDFKIYLANIQILQNASNILTDHQLTILGHVFNRNYNRSNDNEQSSSNVAGSKVKRISAGKLPSENEQNCLLTSLHQEFWDLPTNYQEKPLVFGSQVKNRYKTILPNEHSRVILDSEIQIASEQASSHLREQSTTELYINANYIKGPDYSQNSYIATQGPMLNTIYDFWLMVYQNFKKFLDKSGPNVNALPRQQKIAMLTDIIENDESKCAIYFSQNVNKSLCFMSNEERRQKDSQSSQSQLEAYFNDHSDRWLDSMPPNEIHTEEIDCSTNSFAEFNFNFFAIKTMECINKNGYTVRKFHCLYHTHERLNGTTETADDGSIFNVRTSEQSDKGKHVLHRFVVYHYWFPHWPDHRSPENVDVVLDMCINLLDTDCEQEFLAAKARDESASQDSKPEADESAMATGDDAKAFQLGHTPFTGPIPIIHCSAGIGRTGCVVAILNGLRQLRQSYLSSSASLASDNNGKHVSVDVLGIVSNLRLQRGGMVQNSEQYELIFKTLCLYHQRFLSNQNE